MLDGLLLAAMDPLDRRRVLRPEGDFTAAQRSLLARLDGGGDPAVRPASQDAPGTHAGRAAGGAAGAGVGAD